MHPGVVLRHEIERLRKIHTRAPPTTHILALAVKALEAALNGNMGLRRLSWIDPATDGGSGEMFPHLTGYGGLANGSMVTTDSTAMTSQGKNIKVIGGESSLFDPAEISFMIETIDPHRAATYVACGSRNRRISRVHVEAIARDLAENRWVFNAQPICFARGGRLLDGQHRLQAVILAKRSIEVPVVRGLDELVCLTYENSTKRRTDLGDQLGSFGDRALVYAMANLLWRHERRTPLMRQAKATQGEIRQIVLEHPRLLILRSFARRMGDFGRASVLGYAAYVMERENAVFAADFLAALETGANLRPGSPILSLRGTLQKLRGDKASPTTQLAALLAGWKRFKESALSKGQRGIV